jgi:hypothetical protein
VPEGEEIRRINVNACDCRRECSLDPACAAFAAWSLVDNHGEEDETHAHTACILYSTVEKIAEVEKPGEHWEGALLPRALYIEVEPDAQEGEPFRSRWWVNSLRPATTWRNTWMSHPIPGCSSRKTIAQRRPLRRMLRLARQPTALERRK